MLALYLNDPCSKVFEDHTKCLISISLCFVQNYSKYKFILLDMLVS